MYDSAFIQNTIASQNSFFAQSMALSNMAGYQSQGQQPPMPPSPSPMPTPSVAWASGMSMPPNMVRPQFGSFGGAMGGLMGLSPDRFQFSGGEMRQAAQSQMGYMASDAMMGALSAMPSVLGNIGMLAGGVVGSMTGSPLIGGVAGSYIGDWAGQTAGAPFQWVAERYKMNRTLQMEFQNNPKLNRLNASPFDINNLSSSISRMANQDGLGMERATNLASIGMQGGQFDQALNTEDMSRQMKQYIEGAKNISRIIKVTVEEGGKLLNDLKQMGFFDLNSQVTQMSNIAGAANSAGVGVAQMMQIAGTGANLLGGPQGANTAVGLAGGFGAIGRSGYGANLLSRMGGLEQATTNAMQQSLALSQTGWGNMLFAQGLSGGQGGALGGTFNTSGMSTGIGMDPEKIAKLQSAEWRQKYLASMGPDALAAQISSVKSNMERAYGREVGTWELSRATGIDTDTLNMVTLSQQPDIKLEKMRSSLMSKGGGEKVETWLGKTLGGARGAIGEAKTSAVDYLYSPGGAISGVRSGIGKVTGEYYNPKNQGLVSNLPSREVEETVSMATTTEGEQLVDKYREFEEGFGEQGRWKGALTGAALGSFLPGIGTVAGGIIGYMVGGGNKFQTLMDTSPDFQKALTEYAFAEGGDKNKAYKELEIALRGQLGDDSEDVDKILSDIKSKNSGDLQEYVKSRTARELQGAKEAIRKDLGGLKGTALSSAGFEFGKSLNRETFQSLVDKFKNLSPEEQGKLAGSSEIMKFVSEGVGKNADEETMYNELFQKLATDKTTEKSEETKDMEEAVFKANNITIDAPMNIYLNGTTSTRILQTDAGGNLSSNAMDSTLKVRGASDGSNNAPAPPKTPVATP